MDAFSSNSVSPIEIVKRAIVPPRVPRYSSEGARRTSVRAPRNPGSQPPPRSLLNHSGERLSL